VSTPHVATAASAPGTAAAPVAEELPGRCYRCGNPTPSPDIGLCETCNPSGIAGPTATQVHGLILGAVAGALIVIAVAAKLLTVPVGPFSTSVQGQAAYPDGSAEIAITIRNDGTATTRPTCTIVRGEDDPGSDFLADPIAPGGSITVTKRVAAPPGVASGLPEVTCR
jgi:hypothetical protein